MRTLKHNKNEFTSDAPPPKLNIPGLGVAVALNVNGCDGFVYEFKSKLTIQISK